jgi:tRNA wybutosine-synthesizing protein 1
MKMLTPQAKEALEKQQYRVVGGHSAVKICGWTKHMLKGQGGCYKLKFYGIMSHQCLQMTTSISCANRCIFCWRDYKSPVSKTWDWDVDLPQFILDNALIAQKKLLEGFGGNPKANQELFVQSKEVRHVALSLTGEPLIYPKLNELITLFNQRGISTFLVTNGQHPEALKELQPVTQLYLSLDAPTPELSKEVGKPLFTDYWKRFLESLDILKATTSRTAIRITMIKGVNDIDVPGYAELIQRANPDFIEIKGYMHIGASQERLSRESMPRHEDVAAFAQQFVPYLDDYELITEHVPSRVLLFAHKKFKQKDGWYTWIDFKKYHELVLKNISFSTEEFLKKTPKEFIGIDPESKTFASTDLQNDVRRTYYDPAQQGDESQLE